VALNGLFCADVPLGNYSPTRYPSNSWASCNIWQYIVINSLLFSRSNRPHYGSCQSGVCINTGF